MRPETKRERLARERHRDHRRVYTADTLAHRLRTEELTNEQRRTMTSHEAALRRAEAERTTTTTGRSRR